MFEIGQGLRHEVGRWRDECRFSERAAARPDPVLRCPEFARRELAAADTAHQHSVNLADEAHGDRQFPQAFEPVLRRPHVVRYLGDVTRGTRIHKRGFDGEQILKRALGAFDRTRKDRLLPYVHEHEHIGIGQSAYGPVETPECTIGVREQPLRFTIEIERTIGWQWCGDESRVAG